MTMSPVGSTSLWIAAARALESESDHPLFVDPYARELAGDAGDAIVSAMRQTPGRMLNGAEPLFSVRTRFLDDGVLAAVGERAAPQVVILAAGMDTRAFRLAWPSGTRVFEIDRDEVFDYKEPILTRLGARAACDRRVVRADLAHEWLPTLLEAGFDASRPAAFLVEGLLMYLEPEAVDRLFARLSEIAADESWIGGDIVNSEMLTSPYSAPVMKRLEDLGCPWRFGAAEPEAYLAARGWHGAIVSPGEPRAHYGKWPYPVLPRAIPGMPRIFLMSAKKGAPGQGCDARHLVLE